MKHSMRWIAAILVMGIAVMVAVAQTPAVQKPKFEVASIKPTTIRGPVNTPPGGSYIAVGQTLKALIAYAYCMRDYQVIGGPAWGSTDLWEIQAKAPEGSVQPRQNLDIYKADFDEMEQFLSQPDTIALMLQSLLEDRFHLKIHRETREMGVYEFAVAKGGLKMKLAADQTRPEPAPRGVFPRQANGVLMRGAALVGRGSFEGQAIPFWTLFNSIRNQLDRPLINKVDLKGLYDVKLKWEPDNLQATPGGATPEGPSLTTALQEQLGLRLESTKGPVDVIIIDSVQRPTAN